MYFAINTYIWWHTGGIGSLWYLKVWDGWDGGVFWFSLKVVGFEVLLEASIQSFHRLLLI